MTECLPLLVYGFFFAIGLGTTAFGVVLVRRAAAARRWPTVDGRVVSSRVRESPSMTPDDQYHTMHDAAVRYVYSVDGREYRGTRITMFDGTTSVRKGAEKVAARYPKGGKVRVYVDPADPGRACLAPGAGFFTWLPFAMGVSITLLTTGLALASALK